jgi:hypothetical protein
LSASGTNLLAVRVATTPSFPDIAPLSGDFSVYGGLYRPVHLIVTATENFTPRTTVRRASRGCKRASRKRRRCWT